MKVLPALLLVLSAQAAPREYNIARLGAAEGSADACTKALATAISRASKCGGTIVVPQGRWTIRPTALKSDITLRIEKGAVLLGTTEPRDYLTADSATTVPGLLYGTGLKNVRLCGQGAIDGQGRTVAHNQDSLHFQGRWPWYNPNTRTPSNRVHLICIRHTTGLDISGLTVRNSNQFALLLEKDSLVAVKGLTIRNHAYWNNDGIDINDCTDVSVSDCDIEASDDGICLGSLDHGAASARATIERCRIQSSASAVKFGTTSYGTFRDISVRDITVHDTFRAAIAFECVDGGILENITFDRITATNTGCALFLRLGRRRDNPNHPGHSLLRNIVIRNLKAQIAYGMFNTTADYDMQGPPVAGFYNTMPSSIAGVPGMRVENVRLENVDITAPGRGNDGLAWCPAWKLPLIPELEDAYPEYDMFRELPAWGLYIRHAKGIVLDRVTLRAERPDYRPALVCDDVESLDARGLTVSHDSSKPQIWLRRCEGAECGEAESLIVKN